MSKFLYLLLLLSIITNAQTFGPQRIISIEGNGPQTIFVADLDGDMYKDVMSANKFGSNLTWYKNLGDGTFGEQQIIANLNQPKFIFAADIDGDNNMDILATGLFIDELVWYENVDGLGTFSSKMIITDELDGPYAVYAADIDGDEDIDVVCGSESSGLAWFENLDGNGNFSPKKVINASAPNSRSVMAIDMDGDIDLDIVASSSGAVTVSWYENLDGQGNFGPQKVIAGDASTVQAIYVADLDGDLDNDVIAATNAENKVGWFENLDGMGNFGLENIITLETDTPVSVFIADLDNDTNFDVISASAVDGKIAWYKNLDGEGDFGPQQIIINTLLGANCVFASDIDNDGDMDVFSSSQNDDTIAWYENLTILGYKDFKDFGIQIYPNPVKDTLVIESPVGIQKATVYNILGSKLLEITQNPKEITMAGLPSGVLIIEITTEKGKVIDKVVKE